MSRNPITRHSDATRARILEAATAIFADLGYYAATTRMICVRARANSAAVNYHFGDKLGLYTEVLATTLGRDNERIAEQALLKMAPEAGLREFIARLFDSMITFDAKDQHVRLMAHELSQPTPALATVVERIIRPRARILCAIVARIIHCAPQSLQTRLAVHSIIAQVVHYMHSQPVIKLLWPDWQLDSAARAMIAEHIATFSVCALRSFGRPQRPRAPRRLKGNHT